MLGEWYLPPGKCQAISTITEGIISISHPAPLSSQTRIPQTSSPLVDKSQATQAALLQIRRSEPVPERPQWLAVKPSSAQALQVQASSLAACQSEAGWRVPCCRSSQRFQDEGKPKATSTFHHASLAVSSPAWSPVPRAWSWPEPEWPERSEGRGPWAWARSR